MIGVVLWSDLNDRKAVFWCEDQGDLAYYEATGDVNDGYGFFDAGDMVQFDVRMDRKLRKAHNARLVQEKACQSLPETLRRTAAGSASHQDDKGSAKIIAFTPNTNAATRMAAKRKA